MRVAVLGTGIMGAGMARSLQRAGHETVAWNRTKAKAEPLAEDGITVASSVSEAVRSADAVVTMLFNADATLAVADELVAALGSDAVWVQSGTVGPDGARRIARKSEQMIDAPMVGTKKPAEEGKLVVVASGKKTLLDKAKPVFDAVGGKTVIAGEEIGQASALKLACNSWIAILTAGTAQALALAQALGVDPQLVLDTVGGGPADSPYMQLKGKAMINGEYSPSFAVDGLAKDLDLMRDAASGAGFPTELLTAVRDMFGRASDNGHGSDDIAAVRLAFPA